MSKFIIGIDPGKNGGIVALSGLAGNPKIVDINNMPATVSGLWDYFLYLGFPNLNKKEDTYVFLEKVHSMPSDGRRAAYSFGFSNGQMDAVLDRMVRTPGFSLNLVRPVDWQRYFGLQREKAAGETKYNYKKKLLNFAKTRSQTREISTNSQEEGKGVGKCKSRDVRSNNGTRVQVDKQKVASIKWPSASSRSKLTLKTCDAFLIALYGYNKIMEES